MFARARLCCYTQKVDPSEGVGTIVLLELTSSDQLIFVLKNISSVLQNKLS
jgi:hypothetical protein